jgi:tryptophan halogenase
MIEQLVVLGGGSAGFLAAITLKNRLPQLKITLLRSPQVGIIGVGEGTTPVVLTHLHGYLGLDPADFYRDAQPMWKLGIRFLWGTREYFNYTFSFQYDAQVRDLPKPHGFYAQETDAYTDIPSALMSHDRVFLRQENGGPLIGRDLAYHLENETFVAYLEQVAAQAGLNVVDDTVQEVLRGEEGVTGLRLESGEVLSGDLFLDCSGFRSLLLGDALGEPFESYDGTLFCDRAVLGGWPRGADEPIRPYTTSETMNAGWCWQIEHEHRINRGYVYSSRFISDEQAEAEFRAANPRVESTRVVRFTSGRYRRAWVQNVLAIGNASGFVEPLESTALGVICDDAQALADTLHHCDRTPTPTLVDLYNERSRRVWETIRDFLAIHYKFNRKLDTPFWRECRENVDLCGAARIADFYRENGPMTTWRQFLVDVVDQFRFEGYLALLIGLDAPCEHQYQPSEEELALWRSYLVQLSAQAQQAMKVEEALAVIRSPQWAWTPGFYTS